MPAKQQLHLNASPPILQPLPAHHKSPSLISPWHPPSHTPEHGLCLCASPAALAPPPPVHTCLPKSNIHQTASPPVPEPLPASLIAPPAPPCLSPSPPPRPLPHLPLPPSLLPEHGLCLCVSPLVGECSSNVVHSLGHLWMVRTWTSSGIQGKAQNTSDTYVDNKYEPRLTLKRPTWKASWLRSASTMLSIHHASMSTVPYTTLLLLLLLL